MDVYFLHMVESNETIPFHIVLVNYCEAIVIVVYFVRCSDSDLPEDNFCFP